MEEVVNVDLLCDEDSGLPALSPLFFLSSADGDTAAGPGIRIGSTDGDGFSGEKAKTSYLDSDSRTISDLMIFLTSNKMYLWLKMFIY